MPMWIIKINDPDGYRERDDTYGPFATKDNAITWARENIPGHITWHSHHLKTVDLYDRAKWEAHLPDFLSTVNAVRGAM
jgi:hypothetical protein